MNKKGVIGQIGLFLLFFLLFLGLFNLVIPKKDSQLKDSDFFKQSQSSLNYLAIGDSLTEGIGDESNQGGFVPLLAQDIESHFNIQVTSSNFGVAGNTSQQILDRMKDDPNLKKALESADLITVTVGGNDIMAVVRQNLSTLDESSFLEASKDYQNHLTEMISLAKKGNKRVKIYILGLYNPFFLNFPQIKEMQSIIDDWNEMTKAVISDYSNVHFVPINDRLYKGIDGKDGVVQSDGNQKKVLNDALFSGDHFHPNHIGYQIMSDTVLETLKKYEKKTNN
ncbi:SGNH/GDSL hydrolase family protein [Streptococcus uberis]|uniref:SGNH/GDSL hydrolase family protein n=1 Tax=Streptococcus uberis TaxID=1349 RepID=UPI0027DDF4A0|nr:SGNH/GDSL hydrolase family protein [Streptococcus uberis]MCK1234412.1 SGNH/GDSL hydrolase family protein [Streptococcus uberis]MCK1254835.1 SGNH/GDSL hydrolase family protein [Streptococcus uberis]